MNVSFLSSTEFNDALKTPRRVESCRDELEGEWQDFQFWLNGHLEEHLNSLLTPEDFFVSSNVRPNKVLHTDLYERTLTHELLHLLRRFLEENAPSYAIISSINSVTEDLMDIQVGQFLLNTREIIVEEAAKEVWLSRKLPTS